MIFSLYKNSFPNSYLHIIILQRLFLLINSSFLKRIFEFVFNFIYKDFYFCIQKLILILYIPINQLSRPMFVKKTETEVSLMN